MKTERTLRFGGGVNYITYSRNYVTVLRLKDCTFVSELLFIMRKNVIINYIFVYCLTFKIKTMTPTKIRLNLPLTDEIKSGIIASEVDRITKEYEAKKRQLDTDCKNEIEKMKKLVANMTVINSDVELKRTIRTRTKKVVAKPYNGTEI
jgi:hypothetical protein